METQYNIAPSSFISANRLSYLLPIIIAIIIPFFLGLFQPKYLNSIFNSILIITPIVIIYLIYYEWHYNGTSLTRGFLKYFKPIPSGVIYGSDIEEKGFPYLTLIIIIINTSLYFALPDKLLLILLFFHMMNPI